MVQVDSGILIKPMFQSIQSNGLCQIVFAANSRLYQPSISSKESQSQKDAQFLDWRKIQRLLHSSKHKLSHGTVSDIISDPSNTTPGTCSLPQLGDFQTCPSPSSTLSQLLPRNPPGVPPQSRIRRILSTVGILSVYLWKFVLVSVTFSSIAKVAGARYVFALWACVPSIWFFEHAPWYLVWTWYGFASTATADLRWNIPVPRTLIFWYLCALSAVILAWQAFKNSREVWFYSVLFLAVAVPLEPAFDFITSKIPMPNTNG
jgi:hypothetical protein